MSTAVCSFLCFWAVYHSLCKNSNLVREEAQVSQKKQPVPCFDWLCVFQNISLDDNGDWLYNGTTIDESVSSFHRDSIIIYNRVPKTGSTTLANLMYDRCRDLRYSVIYVRAEKNAHVYSVSDQVRQSSKALITCIIPKWPAPCFTSTSSECICLMAVFTVGHS